MIMIMIKVRAPSGQCSRSLPALSAFGAAHGRHARSDPASARYSLLAGLLTRADRVFTF
jgi:hypothetical protein